MPPKRKAARAVPGPKASTSRKASAAVVRADDGFDPATATRANTSKAVTLESSGRKRGWPRSADVLSAKAAGAGDAASSFTGTGQAAAPQPKPPLQKVARTEPPQRIVARPTAPSAVVSAIKEVGAVMHHDASPGDEGQPMNISLLRRYLPVMPTSINSSGASDAQEWNISDAVVFSTYLAEVQSHLTRHFCQQLARLTTSTAPAFLHAAALGEAALAGPCSSHVSAHTSSGSADQGSLPPIEKLIDRQEQAYRTLRATIAASCTLGHRSCQVLWGPRGSGKHRILRLLSHDVRRTPNTFVMELQGRLLKDDEAALGVIAQQLLSFLQSPQAAQLCAAHYLLRTGTFGFGQLFHFERHMQDGDMVTAAVAAGGPTARATDGADTAPPHISRHVTGSGGRSGVNRRQLPSTVIAPPTKVLPRGARRARWSSSRPASGILADSNGDELAEDTEDNTTEDEEGQGSGVMVTSTTTYLTGGATSALPHLQQALLLLKSQGCSIVVCIRDIDVFGIRCDQLLYVLSGLMHDSDGGIAGTGGGGGLSLVLTSAAPDIRQLEKRLSSRLTCETRYVPLLPWSLCNLLAATLHTTVREASLQARMKEVLRERAELVETLRAGEARQRQGTDGGGKTRKWERKALKRSTTDLEARLHASDTTLRELWTQRRHLLSLLGLETAATSMASAAKSTDSRALGYYSVCGWRSSALPSGLQLQQRAPISGISASASSTTVRTWSVSSLLAHSSLTLEVQCTMCEELLRQLCCATHARQVRGPGGADTVCGSSGPSLVQLVTKLGTELELNSSTSSTVLTVLASHLCKCVSGAVDLLGGSGRHVLLRWLRARLQHEPIPPATTSITSAAQASTASPAGAPQVILLRWQEAAQSMVLSTSDSRVGVDLHASFVLGSSEPAATDGASISRPEYHRPLPGMPVLSLLPPILHDLLADGQLVGMGYGSREVLLVLFYMHIHHTNGVQERTVADLLEDVSSSLGTKAAAALDRGAFRYAIRLLCRWRLLRVVEAHSQLLEICGSDTRLREFLLAVLSKQAEWCEAELGLDAREIMRFRSLL